MQGLLRGTIAKTEEVERGMENRLPAGFGGLILAAGLSSRMGQFKPLLPLRGRTVLENTVDSMLDAGVEEPVVVLGYRAAELEALVKSRYGNGRVRLAYNRRYAETDMLASIREGLAALPSCRAFFLLPGDMPLVTGKTFRLLGQAMPEGNGSIVFPLVYGRRAHPPLIGSAFIGPICRYGGTDGLRGFWRTQQEHILDVPAEDPGCCQDLDTPQQYQSCLAWLSK